MVVFLLIVIIIILAPGLVGILTGGAIGLTAAALPIILVSLGALGIGALLVKGLGEPSENIIHEQAKQAIADKYTAFYVLCKQWSGLTGEYTDPGFVSREENLNGEIRERPYLCCGPLDYRNIEKLLSVLNIPCSPDKYLGQIGKLNFAYKQGKDLFSTKKWYVGNAWNKLTTAWSGNDPTINLEKLAREIERILKISAP